MRKPFSRNQFETRLRYEQLEDKRLLANIDWTNELDENGDLDFNNGFEELFGADAVAAQAIVKRAIADWERVITSFNYDSNQSTGDTYTLTVIAQDRGVTGSGAASGGPDAFDYAAWELSIFSGGRWRICPSSLGEFDWRGDVTGTVYRGIVPEH